MKLGDNDIREFSKLWQEEFGEPISLDDARASVSTLIEIYTLLAQSPEGNDPELRADDSGKSFS